MWSSIVVVISLVLVLTPVNSVPVANDRGLPSTAAMNNNNNNITVLSETATTNTSEISSNKTDSAIPTTTGGGTTTTTTTTTTTGGTTGTTTTTFGTTSSRTGMDDSGISRVLVAVVTAPLHEDARRSIRNTWAALTQSQKKRVDVRFFVGILPENLEHKEAIEDSLNRSMDVVRLNDFTENYHNLTSKAKGIFDWAFTHGYDALMKVDDDSYVRIDKMLHFIDLHAMAGDLDNIYAGHINRQDFGECYVHRNPNSKWYMYDQYPHEQFPDFADGPGFLLGRNALSYISQNKQFLFNYRCDDAAVGIWTELLGLTKIDMKVSIYEFTCSTDDILINPVSAGEMFTLHNYAHICDAGYTLEVCLDKPCLCKGHPDRQKCWQDIIDLPYQDIIPRL